MQLLGRIGAVIGPIMILAACQTDGAATAGSEAAQKAATPQFAPGSPAARGEELAEALCSGCHAIAPGQVSPNPSAPSFADISNRAGTTRASLTTYLKDAHNFPERMNFEVVEEDAEYLAAYISTLQSDDYTPDM